MIRELNLRNDGDVTSGCISHHLADIRLRIEATISTGRILGYKYARTFIGPIGIIAAGSVSCVSRQFRILIDLKSPTSVISQMQMQAVELVIGHHVNEFQDFLLWEKVARHIHMQTSIAESRIILNRHIRQSLLGEQLLQRLLPIKQSRLCSSPQHDAGLVHNQNITLRFTLVERGINLKLYLFLILLSKQQTAVRLEIAFRYLHPRRTWQKIVLRDSCSCDSYRSQSNSAQSEAIG